jgi:hypothetical protein
MTSRYTVREGDCLSSIAHALGFIPDKIWNDDSNAELRANAVAAAIAVADAAVAAAGAAGPQALPVAIAAAARAAAIAAGAAAGLAVPAAAAAWAGGEPFVIVTAVAAATDAQQAADNAMADFDHAAVSGARTVATTVAAHPGWALAAAMQIPNATAPYDEVPWVAVRAATEAALSGVAAAAAATSAAHALAVHDLIPAAKVAYSYGVGANGAHTNTAQGFGHPHPFAVSQYVARGWTGRMNAAAGAAGSHQPDASPAGSWALGWEDHAGGYEGPLRGDGGAGGVIVRGNCPLCDQVQVNC